MKRVSRTALLGALTCAVLVLSGCAAGSPAVVVPETQDATVAEAPEIQADPTEIAVAPEPAAAVIEEAPADAPITEPSTSESDSAPEAIVAPASVGTTSTDSVAFAQEVALTPEPPPAVDPAAAPATDDPAPAAASPDVEFVDEAALAPADTTTRPAPPPDPGTGMSTIVEGGTNGRMEVALTFDAGADTGYGAQILDLLRDEGIKATFGMTGVWAQANPDLVQRMVAEGHQLMNHTWDHSSLNGANTGMPALTPEQVAAQLWDTENLVSEITGGYQMSPYFRPPYGDYDAASLGYLYDNGFTLSIWWTCDSHGWAGWGAQEIIDYCTTNLVEDEILLLHVGAAAAGDFEALPGLIQFFRENGYAFVTVEQMLQP